MTKHMSPPWWSDMVMYWIENQIAITFHSPISLASEQEQARQEVMASLRLPELNLFLQERGFALKPFHPADHSHTHDTPEHTVHHTHEEIDLDNPAGTFLFSAPDHGTIVIGFFEIEQTSTFHPVQDLRMAHGMMHGDSNARQLTKLINHNLETLQQDGHIPIIAAMPNWIGGATGCMTHGCSLRPYPVQKTELHNSAGWSLELPELSPELQARTGKGVTIFVLDTMPKIEQIYQAAQKAGKHNWLLTKVAEEMQAGTIVTRYQPMPAMLAEDAEDLIYTGRDIYSRPAGFSMPDHGLFVTGMIRDLAPDAKIEYVRALSDYGVGDIYTLIGELVKIQQRMAAGDLKGQAVVINLSQVIIPPHDELPHFWYSDDQGCNVDEFMHRMHEIELLQTPLHLVIQSLSVLGAVIVASAGNDSNAPDMPGRMPPRLPAAFPEVISVAAVDQMGNAPLYSDYPTIPSTHNGIATFGGGAPVPTPSMPEPGVTAKVDPTSSSNGVRGLYSSPTYPGLSADDALQAYNAPTNSAWANWSGTSFATPIISALAARLLEQQISSLPKHLRALQMQWIITSEEGQRNSLTSDGVLAQQPTFGVSLLKAVQQRKAKENA